MREMKLASLKNLLMFIYAFVTKKTSLLAKQTSIYG
jgi:hypothetical protein